MSDSIYWCYRDGDVQDDPDDFAKLHDVIFLKPPDVTDNELVDQSVSELGRTAVRRGCLKSAC
jgi:hypothetical protein